MRFKRNKIQIVGFTKKSKKLEGVIKFKKISGNKFLKQKKEDILSKTIFFDKKELSTIKNTDGVLMKKGTSFGY